jgi:hypothetical protein
MCDETLMLTDSKNKIAQEKQLQFKSERKINKSDGWMILLKISPIHLTFQVQFLDTFI